MNKLLSRSRYFETKQSMNKFLKTLTKTQLKRTIVINNFVNSYYVIYPIK
jgi:hypothetical protein